MTSKTGTLKHKVLFYTANFNPVICNSSNAFARIRFLLESTFFMKYGRLSWHIAENDDE